MVEAHMHGGGAHWAPPFVCRAWHTPNGWKSREHPEAPTPVWSTEADELDATAGNAEDLLERICSRENMRAACDRVARNGGAGGVDGMGVAELPAWLDANHEALAGRILAGRYRPKPVTLDMRQSPSSESMR